MEMNGLTTTLNNFISVFNGGWGRLQPAITWLLAALAAIDIVLVGFWWALGGGEQLVNVFKKLLFLTFWGWLVLNFPMLAKAFVNSLISAGFIAGGGGAGQRLLLDPSAIAGYGLIATKPLVDEVSKSGVFELSDAIIFGLCYLVIMGSFVILSIEVFLAVLEFYLLLGVVGILMPWGIFQPTRFISEKAIGAIISAGIKLMILAFILSVADPVLRNIHFSDPTNGIKWNEIWAVILTVGSLAFLAVSGPRLASGLLAGSPSLAFGAAAASAATVAAMSSRNLGTVRAATSASVRTLSQVVGGAYGGGVAAASNVQTGSRASRAATIALGAARGAGTALVRSTIGKVTQPVRQNFQSGVGQGLAA